MIYNYKITVLLLVMLSALIGACGGGSSSNSGGQNPPPASKTVTGVAQKGNFFIDSSVTAYQLNALAIREGKEVSSRVSDDFGSFSITPTWNDWAELSVTGRFFDENAAANSAIELTLNGIAIVGEDSNINLFTHLVAARIRQILSANNNSASLEQARDQAHDDIKNVLGLLSNTVEKLDIADGSSALKNDNANLLLFSGGFMSNNGNATSLLALADDFANNGKFDDVGLSFFQKIANYAGVINNLEKLSANLKQANYTDPPSLSDLESPPSWVNQAPLVTLVPKSKTIIEGQSIHLDGTTSIDPDGLIEELTYSWSGSGTSNCEPKDSCDISNLSLGTHAIKLTVQDGGSNTASETATIIVVAVGNINKAPVAIAEPSILNIKKGLLAKFDASRSFDDDGDSLSYAWSGSGTQSCGDTPVCEISGLQEGVYFISVVVSDGNSGVNSAFSRLTVVAENIPPNAFAGDDQTVSVDRSVDLSGSGTDDDGTIVSYEWKLGNISIGNTKKITVNGLSVGLHEYTLIVTDDNGATASDTVSINITDTSNSAPVANAGNDKTITQGQSVFLIGTASDADGTIESYQWFEGETLLGETANLTLAGLGVGTHQLKLVVTDNLGGNDSDTLTVHVNLLAVTVNISTVGCIVRLGTRNFQVNLTLQGDQTGGGQAILQEYEEAGCTGAKIGGEIPLATTYTITNIQTSPTDFSKTTADMTISNFGGTETRQVSIVDGNVVLPQ